MKIFEVAGVFQKEYTSLRFVYQKNLQPQSVDLALHFPFSFGGNLNRSICSSAGYTWEWIGFGAWHRCHPRAMKRLHSSSAIYGQPVRVSWEHSALMLYIVSKVCKSCRICVFVIPT